MSRLANAILTGQFVANYPSPMLDLRNGGQNGYSPVMTQWVSNQNYVARHLVAMLIEPPIGFQYLPDPAFWVGALKALIEVHPKSISGMARGLEVDFSVENPVSGGGEMQQDFTNITRARTIPSHTYNEKYGRPIQTFIEEYILQLMGDADSKVPGIATLSGVRPSDLLADMYTFTTLYFEPDPTYTTVLKAWLCTNMAPKATGDITGKRELSAAMEGLEITLEFTAISQSNAGVRAFAQSLLDSINFAGANPNLAPAFVQAIDPNVLASTSGYANQVQNLANTALR